MSQLDALRRTSLKINLRSMMRRTFSAAQSHHCNIPAVVSVTRLLSSMPCEMQTASPASPTFHDCTCHTASAQGSYPPYKERYRVLSQSKSEKCTSPMGEQTPYGALATLHWSHLQSFVLVHYKCILHQACSPATTRHVSVCMSQDHEQFNDPLRGTPLPWRLSQRGGRSRQSIQSASGARPARKLRILCVRPPPG